MSIPIRLPAITADFEAGTIAEWHKSVGDNVEKGDVIADIETDKAVVEVQAIDTGVLGSILVPAGSEGVSVNTVIALLLEGGESVDDIRSIESAPVKDKGSESINDVIVSETVAAPMMPDARVFASPLARRIAGQHKFDLRQLAGRGPNGRILKADVEQALKGAQQAFTEIPHNNVRKVIARRLTDAKQQVPHFYLTVDCELDALLDTRKQINDHHKSIGADMKVSVNDCIVKAVSLALLDVPAANASWAENAIRRFNDIDIAVAVSTDSGLFTPVVRHADKKSLDAISAEIKDLARRANDGRLHPDEYKGGGFTISNLGMFGIKEFSAIINPPQSCILAIGAGEKRPVVRGETVVVATVMSCTLSVDHRSVDGAVGAEFLRAFKKYIERPASLILG